MLVLSYLMYFFTVTFLSDLFHLNLPPISRFFQNSFPRLPSDVASGAPTAVEAEFTPRLPTQRSFQTSTPQPCSYPHPEPPTKNWQQQVWPLTHFILFPIYRKIIDLPGGQINHPLLGKNFSLPFLLASPSSLS